MSIEDIANKCEDLQAVFAYVKDSAYLMDPVEIITHGRGMRPIINQKDYALVRFGESKIDEKNTFWNLVLQPYASPGKGYAITIPKLAEEGDCIDFEDPETLE